MVERFTRTTTDFGRQVGFYTQRLQDGYVPSQETVGRALHWHLAGALAGQVSLAAIAELIKGHENMRIIDEATGVVAPLGSLAIGKERSEGVGVESFVLEGSTGTVELRLGDHTLPDFELAAA